MAKSSGGSLLSSIVLQRDTKQSLQYQLYCQLRDMILNGQLMTSERLPASRVLATELGISRTTVINVYDRLTSEELLVSKTGSGSFVNDVFAQQQRSIATNLEDQATNTDPKNSEHPLLSKSFIRKSKLQPKPIQHSTSQTFSTAMPAIDVFPLALWSRIVARHSRLTNLTGYNSSKGSKALRQAIASHLHADRGMQCNYQQVYITSGAHQAFSFLAQLLLDPGDKVWIENPGSRVALNGLSQIDPELVPVPVDDQGFDVKAALALCADFKVATVTPSHQQPRGVLLSLARRLALIEAADSANAWIIEDDYDGELFYNHEPLPTLFSLSNSQRVITVGTFSKTLFPALRIGYFVAPMHLVASIDKVINSFLPAVPLPMQEALAEFIRDGHFATHIRRSKKLYIARYQAILSSIELHLSDYLTPIPTTTGFQLLALFKQPFDEQEVASAALQYNVLVRPLGNYCSKAVTERGIALGYGCTSVVEINSAIEKLSLVFKQLLAKQQ